MYIYIYIYIIETTTNHVCQDDQNRYNGSI